MGALPVMPRFTPGGIFRILQAHKQPRLVRLFDGHVFVLKELIIPALTPKRSETLEMLESTCIPGRSNVLYAEPLTTSPSQKNNMHFNTIGHWAHVAF